MEKRAVPLEQHEVVIIGNGPSSLVLSYLLSGNWPYYQHDNPHPLQHLHARLEALGSTSLLEADLVPLCAGLTGRSVNPVSLLLDHLQHPQTDLGCRQASTLSWSRQSAERTIDHIVLGAGGPGGVWGELAKHKRFHNIQAVSRRRWMELPDLELESRRDGDDQSNERVTFKELAEYYTRYMEHFQLSEHFVHHTKVVNVHWDPNLEGYVVEAVQKMPATMCDSRLACLLRAGKCRTRKSLLFSSSSTYQTRRFLCRKLVLATGNSTHPVMLKVPGEEQHRFVLHSNDQLDGVLSSGRPLKDIVLVVGSGLSAADAISVLSNATTKNGTPVRVVHIFRRSINDRSLIFRQLSHPTLYPEYQQVYSRMKSTTKQPLCLDCFSSSSALYQAYPRCVINSIASNRTVSLSFLDQHHEPSCVECNQPLWAKSTQLKVSLVQILVGRRPELDFLEPEILDLLGRHEGVAIDARHNPIVIEPYSHRALKANNIYAIGPLVGDNFVRFLQGGALAVANDIHRQRHEQAPHHVETNTL